jgi:acyl transferase domain-containing protein
VKRARQSAQDADLPASEPLAVVGMACRFPGGANSPEEFWKLLDAGVDAVREIPAGRWKNTDKLAKQALYGGWREDIDQFDAAFFDISPVEAKEIDPQQRFLLEVTWEALADAGIPAASLSGSRTGVFVALCNQDYLRSQLHHAKLTGARTGPGAAQSMAAGRISYTLNAQGPSLVVDTACSSSLVAVHLACQSLRLRECGVAIAAASNLKISPDEASASAEWGMLAGDGKCKVFDSRADGFVAGEGCGVVVLKRLVDALAAEDHIYAVIRGTAVNQDGRSTVLTAPNGPAQESVIRAALENGAVRASDVSFVETHGTGTSLGDPIEVGALRSVYGNASGAAPCMLGAVKTNIGHLESTAGMAGLIKVALSLEHERVPRNLHFRSLNPEISIEGSRLLPAAHGMEWPRGQQPRFAGLSAFGMSGTNAHMILEEAPAQARVNSETPAADELLLLSARSENALRCVADRYCDFLAATDASLADICRTAAMRRSHYEWRLAVSGGTRDELIDGLKDFVAGRKNRRVKTGRVGRAQPIGVALTASTEMHSNAEEAAGRYVEGRSANWMAVLPAKGRVVSLPHLPWQHERFWFEEAEDAELKRGEEFSPANADATMGLSSSASWEQTFEAVQVASGDERRRMICGFIQREAAAVLGLRRGELPPLDVPLTDMGLDSLMAVNLRNRMRAALGHELPLRFVIERPTVFALADALDTILWTMQEEPAQQNSSLQQDEIRL